jgi:hypothetical protein
MVSAVIRVQAAFLANAAQLDPTGLISSLGGFIDTVTGEQLPVRQQIWLVGRLNVEAEDARLPHTVAVIVEHSDGSEQVARIDIPLPAGPEGALAGIDADMPLGVPIVIPLPLEFRHLGIYRARIVVDGDEVWGQSLKIVTTIPQL